MAMSRKWIVRGIRNSSVLKSRIVEADSRYDAVLRASKGRNFMLVRDCVLLTDGDADRKAAILAAQTSYHDGMFRAQAQ